MQQLLPDPKETGFFYVSPFKSEQTSRVLQHDCGQNCITCNFVFILVVGSFPLDNWDLVTSAKGKGGESGRIIFVDSGLEDHEEPSSSNILWLLFSPSL